jgi:hypothetical protein
VEDVRSKKTSKPLPKKQGLRTDDRVGVEPVTRSPVPNGREPTLSELECTFAGTDTVFVKKTIRLLLRSKTAVVQSVKSLSRELRISIMITTAVPTTRMDRRAEIASVGYSAGVVTRLSVLLKRATNSKELPSTSACDRLGTPRGCGVDGNMSVFQTEVAGSCPVIPSTEMSFAYCGHFPRNMSLSRLWVSSSVVEHFVANEDVAGSNPV